MMMRRTSRGSFFSAGTALLAFQMCLCVFVFMQMLGVPVTFWDLDASVEGDISSFLEGFAIPTDHPLIRPSHVLSCNIGGMSRLRSVLRDHDVFHPPTAPSSSITG